MRAAAPVAISSISSAKASKSSPTITTPKPSSRPATSPPFSPPRYHPTNIRVEPLESLSFPDNAFDVVHCNAVLHFARDEAHFNAMLQSLWRILKPGGLLLCRLASNIGLHHEHLNGRHYLAPDGVKLYCVDEALLMQLTQNSKPN